MKSVEERKARLQVELNKFQEKYNKYVSIIYVDEIFNDGTVYIIADRMTKDGFDTLIHIMKRFNYRCTVFEPANDEELLFEFELVKGSDLNGIGDKIQ